MDVWPGPPSNGDIARPLHHRHPSGSCNSAGGTWLLPPTTHRGYINHLPLGYYGRELPKQANLLFLNITPGHCPGAVAHSTTCRGCHRHGSHIRAHTSS